MLDDLMQTWQIHNRINLYLLEAIDPQHLANVGPSKGRSVGEAFAHVHNVRLMWLSSANPALLEGLSKVEKDQALQKNVLAQSLQASGEGVDTLVRQAVGDGNRIKGFKPHPTAFVGYLISHESHHRGQIVLTLKQTGAPVDKKVAYGIWEWGVR